MTTVVEDVTVAEVTEEIVDVLVFMEEASVSVVNDVVVVEVGESECCTAVVTEETVVVATVQIQGPPGVSSTTAINDILVGFEWGDPTAESGNAIEISGQVKSFNDSPLASDVVDITVVVTDGAADAEPSATATLSAASTPVGTVLAGTGTATLVIRSVAGLIALRVTETGPGHRYLWLRNGGHALLWIRSLTGVQELVFT